MLSLRTIASVLVRQAARPTRRAAFMQQPTTASAYRMHPCISLSRSYAAEAGYLDKNEVEGRVMEVIRKFEKVQPEKVNPGAHFINDLGLDSLDTVELVMAFEDEFAIEIPDAEAEKILSCEDAIAYLANNAHAK